jgi:hypothetical protein
VPDDVRRVDSRFAAGSNLVALVCTVLPSHGARTAAWLSLSFLFTSEGRPGLPRLTDRTEVKRVFWRARTLGHTYGTRGAGPHPVIFYCLVVPKCLGDFSPNHVALNMEILPYSFLYKCRKYE